MQEKISKVTNDTKDNLSRLGGQLSTMEMNVANLTEKLDEI